MSAVQQQLQRAAEREAQAFHPALQSLVMKELEAVHAAVLEERRHALATLKKAKDPGDVVAPLQAKMTLLKSKRAALDLDLQLLRHELAACDLEIRTTYSAAERHVQQLRRAALPPSLVQATRAALEVEMARLRSIGNLPVTTVEYREIGRVVTSVGPAQRRVNEAITQLERAVGDLEHMASGIFEGPAELDVWVTQLVQRARDHAALG
jgi:hypothetical protein